MSKKYLNMGHNEILGNIVFGQGCIINPTCSIICEKKEENYKIIFGDYNVIEERALIIFKPNQKDNIMRIGSYNVFGIRSHVVNCEIGDNNILQPRASLTDTRLGSCNIIGSQVKILKKVIGNRNRVFHPGVMKIVDVFDENAHQENLKALFSLSSVAP